MNTTINDAERNSCAADDHLVIEAANDNPGGPTAATISLDKLVCLMARSYVTTLKAEDVK